ncbi:MAG: hypothetical protein HKM95_15245 [Inquilinus sp.]|nr:hypothetical protein [Inquilinus sp.]
MSMDTASRLDRMIARLSAQRAHIEAAAALIREVPGPVLEIGLGKGRTFDHLRKLLGDREIFAYDGTLHAPAGAVPDPDHLVLGDFRETLPAAMERLPAPAALAHADFGSEDRARDAAQAAWLGPLIDGLMAPGAVVLSDRELSAPRWTAIDGSGRDWPYFLWRVGPRP